MPIPDYQTLMRPVLGMALAKEIPAKEIVTQVADLYELTDEERQERIPSGAATLLANRVHWAITYMVQADLMKRPRRAIVIATDRGRNVYQNHSDRIDNAVLSQFDEFIAF